VRPALAAVPHIEQPSGFDPRLSSCIIPLLGWLILVAGKFETARRCSRERIQLAPKTDLSRAFLLSRSAICERGAGGSGESDGDHPKYSFAELLDGCPSAIRPTLTIWPGTQQGGDPAPLLLSGGYALDKT